MTPLRLALLVFAFGLLAPALAATPLHAEEAPAAEAAPPANSPLALATDEEAEAALDRFKEEYRARGLKGQEKLSQRDFALENLSAVQHPDVVKELAKIARGRQEVLRTLAVLYLGEQRALPVIAGKEVASVLKRHGKKDDVLAMSALDSLARLRYLGANELLADYLDHNNFAVKKAAIQAIGRIGDMRLWKEILALAGVSVKDGGAEGSNSKEVVVEEGYSYEGAEEKVDWGMADNTAENAEAKRRVEAKIAANKAAAMAGRGGGMGGGGATTGGGVARSPKELLPAVLETLYMLTGEKFDDPKDLVAWVIENMDRIEDKVAMTEALEKAQEEEAKERD